MATIHVHIARHFWRDQEYAAWQSSDMFPPSLLAWLKEHYAELVAGAQPKWVEHPEGKICLFFNEEKEVHGRKATRLTACWSKENIANINEVYTQLEKIQGLTHSDSLSFSIKVTQTKGQGKPIDKLKMVAAFVLVAVGAYWFYSGQENSIAIDQVGIKKAPEVITKETSSEPHKTPQPPILKSDKTISQAFSICQKITEGHYCFQKFIRKKCAQKTALNYQKWLQKVYASDPSGSTNQGCPKRFKSLSDDPDIATYLSKHVISKAQKNKLQYFLTKSRDIP